MYLKGLLRILRSEVIADFCLSASQILVIKSLLQTQRFIPQKQYISDCHSMKKNLLAQVFGRGDWRTSDEMRFQMKQGGGKLLLL